MRAAVSPGQVSVQSSFNAELALARMEALGLVLRGLLQAMVRQGLLGHEQLEGLEREAMATALELQATGNSKLQVGGARLEVELRGFFASVSRRGQEL